MAQGPDQRNLPVGEFPDTDSGRSSDPERALGESDHEAVALHDAASRRLEAATAERPVSFGRQMIQLTLIPALIVGAVIGVWMLVITLGGQGQTLTRILDRLETAPAAEGASIVDRPAHQERARAAVNLMGWLEDTDSLSDEDRELLLERLPRIARLYRGREVELSQYVMGALGMLADPSTLPVFEESLRSQNPGDRLAAAVGLASWQGPTRELQPLTLALVDALNAATGDSDEDARARTLLSLVLGGAAPPGSTEARDALARVVDRFGVADREAAWNAGAALAAIGDERGIPVLLTLLDREDLARRPQEPEEPELGAMSIASQDKLIATAINIAVGFNPDTGRHFVRVQDPDVWRMIERLAENDPSDEIRDLARKALAVYDDEMKEDGEDRG